jgi:CheY-like chemotaxis protein
MAVGCDGDSLLTVGAPTAYSTAKQEHFHEEERLNASEVREALEYLYANVELAATPLASGGRFVDPEAGVVQRAQAVRNVLLDAIEALRPQRLQREPLGRSGRSSYEVLSLRYVSCLSIDEMADRLAVGSRQIYRDLRRAEEELMVILETLVGEVGTPESSGHGEGVPSPCPATHFRAEVEALTRRQDVIDLGELLRSARATVTALAAQKQIDLYQLPLPRPVTVTVTPGIAKEMLIQLLSALIQQSPPGQRLVMRTEEAAQQVIVRMTVPRDDFAWENPLLHNALLMAQLLEMSVMLQTVAGADHELKLVFPTAPMQIALIVEDNPGVSELYVRYLEGSSWRLALLADPTDTLARARALQPSVIVLDLLMPEVDGWTVLQSLRASPDLAHIPVIICSVVNDPELAQALGAAASLTKPVSRLELMEALYRVTKEHSAGALGARSA